MLQAERDTSDHTVVELQNSGYETVIIDNLSNSTEDVTDRIEKITRKRPGFVKLDLCDANGLGNFLDANPEIDTSDTFCSIQSCRGVYSGTLLMFVTGDKILRNDKIS